MEQNVLEEMKGKEKKEMELTNLVWTKRIERNGI